MKVDLEQRRLVWAAMSELYLDNELTDDELQHVARVLCESPYSQPELERIMFGEVFPVLNGNLSQAAGEWTGFDMDWLERTIVDRANGAWNWPTTMIPRKHLVLERWKVVIANAAQPKAS